MSGSSSQQQQTFQQGTQAGQSNPWGQAIPELQTILGQIGQQNLSPTAAQTSAANNLVNAAQGIPNLGPQAAGTIGSYLNPNFTNPYNNPALSNAFNSLNQQIGSGIAGQFAAAGRDPSGNAQAPEAIARGEAQAEAPILANEYNNLLGYQQSAIPLAGQIPGLYTGPGAAQYGAAGLQANLPLANLQGALGATLPIAGLGGSYSGNYSGSGTSNTQGQSFNPLGIAGLFGGGPNSAASGIAGMGSGVLGFLGL